MNNKTHKENVKTREFISDTFLSLQFAPIPACITDAGGKVLRGNKAFLRILNPNSTKKSPGNFQDFIEFQDSAVNFSVLVNEWREKDAGKSYQVNLLTNDNSKIPFQLSCARIENEKSNYFVFYLYHDENNVELNIKDLDSAFLHLSNLIDDGIYITDDKGNFRFANEEFCKRKNLSLNELIGRHYLEFQDEKQKPVAQNCFSKVMQGKVSQKNKFYFKDPRGNTRCYRSKNVPIKKENKVIGMLGISKDITAAEKVEQDLKRYINIENKIDKISKLLYESRNVKLCLAELGKMMNAKRAAIYQFRDQFAKMQGIMEWCEEGETPLLPEFEKLDTGKLQWWICKLQKGENIIIKDVTKLPPDAKNEREFCESVNIESLIAFPLQVDYELVGFVALDMSGAKTKLTDFEIQCLRFMADMISMHFYRIQYGKGIQEVEQRYRDLIEASFSAVVIHRNKKILYVNQTGLDLFAAEDLKQLEGKSILEIVHPDDIELIKSRYKMFEKNPVLPISEQRFLNFKGETIHLEVATMGINYHGEKAHLTIVRDITARKKAEIALKESEQRYRQFIETSAEGVSLIDLKGRLLMINNSGALMLGYRSKEEMMAAGKSVFDHIVPEHKERSLKHIREVVSHGSMNNIVTNARTKKNELINVETNNSLIRDNAGNPSSIISFFHDITHKKRLERELRESKERYQLLIDNQIDLVVKVDTDGRFLFVSPSYCQTFGKTEEELLGKNFMPLVLEEDREKTERAMKNLYKPPYTCKVEQRAMTQNGLRWLAWIDKAILDENNNVIEIVGVGRDITEQKQIEQELRASEERFRELAELLPEIVFEMDLNGDFTYVNRIAFAMTGYAQEDVDKGVNVMDLVPPEERKRAEESLEKYSKGEAVLYREYTLIRKDGSIFPVIARSSSIRQNGEVIGIRGIITDITELNKTAEALKNSEQRFRDIIERSIDGYYFIDTQGTVVYLNDAAERIFGYSKEKMNETGMFSDKFYKSELVDQARKNYSQIMSGKSKTWAEIQYIHPSGQQIWLGFNGRRVIENGIVIGIEGFVKDVTKQKVSEIEIRNSEARYRTLFKNIPYEVFNLNSNGYLRDANMQFRSKWGNLLKKKILKTPNELLLNQKIREMVNQIQTTREAVQNEFEIPEQNESIFYRMIISPIIPLDNVIIGFVGLNIDITDQVKAIEQTKNFSARLVQIQEDEREHISREIHDNLGQILTALQFELTTAEAALKTDINLSKRKLRDSHQTLSKAIVEARNLCGTLRPYLLDDFGLDVALKDYLKDFSRKWKIDVEMKIESISGSLPTDEEISLYRVTQEALNNTLKYAKATKVFVELYIQNDKIILTINDNGGGFDSKNMKNGHQLHLGLIGMRERVEFLNGDLIINSEITKGTEIKAVIPVKR